ncbi:hypothetical protein XELAEV_18044204mg [Xenopus laevis]|uniref:Uncharacterized protein n=1 Tax=Xenopus laevis TaxID=8355 RepID=A0A974H353_XENLA|nr:hypothetical protein XELAEV_18044204mg [Xenopus laevis]
MTSAPPVPQNNGKKAAVERYIGHHTSLTRQTHVGQGAGMAFSPDIVFMIRVEFPHIGLLFICSIEEHQHHSYNLTALYPLPNKG